MGRKQDTLTREFIDELQGESIDFNKCKSLLDSGVDINWQMPNGENILSDFIFDLYSDGENMLRTIIFFIDNGFDVGKENGEYGARCLQALCYATYDEHILQAAKALIRAGAIDIPVDESTAFSIAATKESFYFVEKNYELSNLFEAYIQILNDLRMGNTNSGADLYSRAKGKKINHVYALKESGKGTFFNEEDHRNSFVDTLFLEYDEGFLVIDRYISTWTVKKLPHGEIEDVSEYFSDILGRTILDINFKQIDIENVNDNPQIVLETDMGKKVIFSSNVNETDSEEEYRAHFKIIF